MPHLKFKSNAPNHTRELSAKDLHGLGVEGEVKKLSVTSGTTVEVSDEVAKILVEKLGDEFEVVDEPEGRQAEAPSTEDEHVDPPSEPSGDAGEGTSGGTRATRTTR